MKALWFLTYRILINSIRRAIRNPLRAIFTFLIFGGLLLYLVVLPLHLHPEKYKQPEIPFREQGLQGVIALLTLFHLFILSAPFSVFYGKNSIFYDADINFLLPLPIQRLKLLRNIFLMRGAFTVLGFFLMSWLLMIFIAWKYLIGVLTLETKVPVGFVVIYPALYIIAYLTVALIGIYLGIKIYRMQLSVRFIRYVFLLATIVIVCIVFQHGMNSVEDGNSFIKGVVSGFDHFVVYILLFPFRVLSEAVLVIFVGINEVIVWGCFLWLLGFGVAYFAIKMQKDWLYDYIVSMVQKRTVAFEQFKNSTAILSMLTKQKEKSGRKRLRGTWLAENWKPKGVWALTWCNLISLWRTNGNFLLLFSLFIGILFALFVLYAPSKSDFSPEGYILPVIVIVQLLIIIIFIGGNYTTLLDSFRRIDLEKALPLHASSAIIARVLHIIMMCAIYSAIVFMPSLVISPIYWNTILLVFIIGLSTLIPICVGMFILFTINPDPTDPVQRAVNNLYLLIVVIVCAIPAGIVLAISIVLKFPQIIIGLLALLTNLGITHILKLIAVERYRRFNPAE